ncbi:hypothetical protein [Halomicronema sp. CCY15110]|uniref:hypothetical protein n=1 Tax=Halomicronema sp. CCY15110 TaxID=2767773 RepID=UPI001951228F|nr:hypothetical protein [Halomicronema sp. CCY15110]
MPFAQGHIGRQGWFTIGSTETIRVKLPVLLDQMGFVVKVLGMSAAIAIAFKTVAPQLPIPATSAVSLAIVLLPSLIVGAILTWQLWKLNHADATHPRRD